jgi:hypothetical protein
VLEDKALRRMLGPKRMKVTRHWRKLYNEDIRNLYFITMIKSGRMRWSRHTARMGEMRIRYIKVFGKLKTLVPLGRLGLWGERIIL